VGVHPEGIHPEGHPETTAGASFSLNVLFKLVTKCTKFMSPEKVTDGHIVDYKFQVGKVGGNFLEQIQKKVV
jgi:hypothetical protein